MVNYESRLMFKFWAGEDRQVPLEHHKEALTHFKHDTV